MSVLGAVNVILGFDSEQFARGAERAQETMTLFGSKMMGAMAAVAGSAALMATGLVFATNGVREAIKEMDDLQRDSGLAVEELQRMSFASKALGGDLGTVVNGLKRLRDNLENLDDDDNKIGKALEAIGVSAKNANGGLKTAQQVFDEVVNTLARYRDGANKSAIANAVFGDSGDALIKIMQDGTGKFEELKKQAEQYGAVVGGDATQATLAFNESMAKINLAKDAFLGSINKALIPALADMAEKFLGVASASKEFEGVTRVLEVGIKAIAAGFVVLSGIVAAFLNLVGNAATAVHKLFSGDFKGAGEAAIKSVVEPMNIIMADTFAMLDAFNKKADPGRLSKFAESARQLQRATREGAPKLDEAEKENRRLALFEESVRKRIDLLQREREIIGLGTAEKLKANLAAEYESVLRKGNIKLSTEEEAKRRALIETAFQEAKANEAVQESFNRFRANVDAFGSAFGSAIDKMLEGTFKFNESIKDLGKSLLKLWANQAFASLFGTSSKPGSLNLGSLFGFGGHRAGGGPVNAGQAYMVGEAGRELFVPNAPGQIVSNGQLAHMGRGGGSVTNIINAAGADPAGLARVERALGEMNRNYEKRWSATQRNQQLRGLRPA